MVSKKIFLISLFLFYFGILMVPIAFLIDMFEVVLLSSAFILTGAILLGVKCSCPYCGMGKGKRYMPPYYPLTHTFKNIMFINKKCFICPACKSNVEIK